MAMAVFKRVGPEPFLYHFLSGWNSNYYLVVLILNFFNIENLEYCLLTLGCEDYMHVVALKVQTNGTVFLTLGIP